VFHFGMGRTRRLCQQWKPSLGLKDRQKLSLLGGRL
jgi:hypothetical protein